MSDLFARDVGASSNSFNQKKMAMLNATPRNRFDYEILIKKALLLQRFFVYVNKLDCSFRNYNFCEVGSGVTIVSTGSVVGAEHAATVKASTIPTTTFLIIYPFTNITASYALIKT